MGITTLTKFTHPLAAIIAHLPKGASTLIQLLRTGHNLARVAQSSYPQSNGSMIRRIPFGLVAAYWRLTRGATLGAQGIVVDESDRVLLVRHGYRPGWHFPGGGIEWRETAESALARELHEEAGVVIKDRPQFHGLFANFTALPSDHIALFIVRSWDRPKIPPPNHEIAESRFFARDAIPNNVTLGTARRLAELFDGAPIEPNW